MFHLADEAAPVCPVCAASGTLIKQLNTFVTQRSLKRKNKVGEITETFIKDAKEEFKRHKRDLEKKR